MPLQPDPLPVTIATADAWGRRVGSDLAEALAGADVDTRRRRLPGSPPGSWLVTSGRVRSTDRPELVIVPEDDTRAAVEEERPDLIGQVWVWDDPHLPELLARRYRPRRRGSPMKVGVVGYNLKFFRPVEEHLRRLPGVEVMVAEWPKYAVDSPADTARVLEWADVVVCEWAGPNAVVASREIRPHQRLVVRLHRFELDREDWRDILIDRVDTVVAVGEPYRRRILDVTAWPEERVAVIPNQVDAAQLDRPKLPNASTTIGLLGATPWRKRPDRALDVLEQLRDADRGWKLSVKGPRPEDDRWIWEDAEHASRFRGLYERIEGLDGAATWDPAGPNVAGWFRTVGHVLSPSEDESFHLAPAEGMASGTVPVIWPWFGADEIYDRRWIVDDVAAATTAILGRTDADREACRREVSRYDRDRVLPEWERLLLPEP